MKKKEINNIIKEAYEAGFLKQTVDPWGGYYKKFSKGYGYYVPVETLHKFIKFVMKRKGH